MHCGCKINRGHRMITIMSTSALSIDPYLPLLSEHSTAKPIESSLGRFISPSCCSALHFQLVLQFLCLQMLRSCLYVVHVFIFVNSVLLFAAMALLWSLAIDLPPNLNLTTLKMNQTFQSNFVIGFT